MIKKFTRRIKESQSTYKAILKKKEGTTQQCSYNLPIDLEAYLKSLGALVRESDPSAVTNVLYGSNYDVVLGANILAIIGDSYNGKVANVVFTHTEGLGGTSKKFQLKKTDFASKHDDTYNWFVELYENNVENTDFVVLVDDVERVITFDVELTTTIFTGLSTEEDDDKEDETEEERPSVKVVGGYNKYYYGAPGCGKSSHITKMLNVYGVKNENWFRVTFHPDYSNSDFIGQILPTIEEVTKPDGTSEEKVKYIFSPGPFTKALVRSYETGSMVYLIIEELNRGNAAAIFGDLFQLLDRVNDPLDSRFSESEYPITNPNLFDYMKNELQKRDIPYRDKDIIIPSNLTILATMNTSDQNVFTLDTAFKRRWMAEGIKNNIKDDTEHKYKEWYVPGTDVSWKKFLVCINKEIVDFSLNNSINEDKSLGKYFVAKNCLTETIKDIDECLDEAKNFSYKVLEYLWDDVCKIDRSKWFKEKYKTLEQLLDGFIEEQLNVFLTLKFE